VYGVILSMKKGGEGSGPPESCKAMFELLHAHVWELGVLDACHAMLKATRLRLRTVPSSRKRAPKSTIR
jgi:hypothetical protein